MAGFQLAGPAADVSKILYGERRKSYQSPNAQYNNFWFQRRPTAECSNQLEGTEFYKIPAFGSGAASESGVIVLSVWALVRFATFTIQNFRHMCSRTCQLESSHLDTKIAITFPIFSFRS
jgi:hypothetical protein